jgi:two-component system NtrC family response regulator
MTAYSDLDSAVSAFQGGAFEYLPKPFDVNHALELIHRALDEGGRGDEVVGLEAGPMGEAMLGQAPAMQDVFRAIGRLAQSHATVLITGETGSGKELVAHALHRHSPRKDKPFIALNTAAIPKDLLESELFGHTQGSFTGAISHKRGRVETAEGGTLFLDEIGELPLELQVKLLRLIQHGEIEKVGSTGTVHVNVRIIAATNRNLKAMVEEGAFREDLYYRLAVIPLELPPLRARAEDIPELTEYLFLQLKQKHGRPELRLLASLLPYFAGYDWPGNVRELENCIERLVVLTAGNEVTLDDLPECLQREKAAVDELRLDLPDERLSLEGVEKELIVRALRKFSWNQTKAANYLDISRRTLIYRMEKFGLRKQ